jgi:phytoene dehydrogenase-like protein
VLAGLLAEPPPDVARYRYGPGTLMVHLALDDLPPWSAPAARGFAYVHVAPSLDAMALAYQQASAGLLPERPVLVVGQPTAVDPSRAPAGKHVLWIQARVVPGALRGDGAGEIEARDWDAAKEAFADRVLALLELYAPGLRELVLARAVLSPADLERANPNLVGGDQLSGSHHAFQFFFLRPLPGWTRYRTPVERLYLCGAATWPGAGVGAGSGYLLGKQLAG